MSLPRFIGYIRVGAMIVFFGIVMWKVFPMLASNQSLSQTALMRLALAVFPKPWNLLTWMVLTAYGIASSWKVRSNWRQDRGALMSCGRRGACDRAFGLISTISRPGVESLGRWLKFELAQAHSPLPDGKAHFIQPA